MFIALHNASPFSQLIITAFGETLVSLTNKVDAGLTEGQTKDDKNQANEQYGGQHGFNALQQNFSP